MPPVGTSLHPNNTSKASPTNSTIENSNASRSQGITGGKTGNGMEVLASVLREEGGEGADFQHAPGIPRGVELLHLPVVDVGVLVPRLGLVVLTLPPPFLPLRRTL
jgi:hypothetical protein